MTKIIKPIPQRYSPEKMREDSDIVREWGEIADSAAENEIEEIAQIKDSTMFRPMISEIKEKLDYLFVSIKEIDESIPEEYIFFEDLSEKSGIEFLKPFVKDIPASCFDDFLIALKPWCLDHKNHLFIKAWIETHGLNNEEYNCQQIIGVITNVIYHKDRVGLAIDMINGNLSLEDIKIILKEVIYNFETYCVESQDQDWKSGNELYQESNDKTGIYDINKNCADIAIEWLNHQDQELKAQYAQQLVDEGLLQQKILGYVLGQEDYTSSEEMDIDFDNHNPSPKKRMSDFEQQDYPKRLRDEFLGVCKTLNENKGKDDDLCDRVFEDFIADDARYLKINFLVDKISQYDNFLCSEFLRYWISTYGRGGVGHNHLCQVISGLNPQEFSQNLSLVLFSIENNQYNLEEISKINQALTQSATNIEDGGYFDFDSRVFEVKFRLSIVWLGLYENPILRQNMLDQLCKEMDFNDDSKKKIIEVFAGQETIEGVIDDFKKHSRDIDDMGIEDLFKEDDDPKDPSNARAQAVADVKKNMVNFYS